MAERPKSGNPTSAGPGSREARRAVGGSLRGMNREELQKVRDKHRVECKGLLGCRTHPVPVVTIQYNEDGLIIYETDYTRRTYPTLPEAMDAARALVVSE